MYNVLTFEFHTGRNMLISNADFQKAQKAAEELVRSYNYDIPPVDPVTLARAMCIEVRFVTFSDPDINAKVSGFFDFEENTIYVNERAT